MSYEDLLQLLCALVAKVGPVTVTEDDCDFGDRELSVVLPAGTQDIVLSMVDSDPSTPEGTQVVEVDGQIVSTTLLF